MTLSLPSTSQQSHDVSEASVPSILVGIKRKNPYSDDKASKSPSELIALEALKEFSSNVSDLALAVKKAKKVRFLDEKITTPSEEKSLATYHSFHPSFLNLPKLPVSLMDCKENIAPSEDLKRPLDLSSELLSQNEEKTLFRLIAGLLIEKKTFS